jgi:hypothetical protein
LGALVRESAKIRDEAARLPAGAAPPYLASLDEQTCPSAAKEIERLGLRDLAVGLPERLGAEVTPVPLGASLPDLVFSNPGGAHPAYAQVKTASWSGTATISATLRRSVNGVSAAYGAGDVNVFLVVINGSGGRGYTAVPLIGVFSVAELAHMSLIRHSLAGRRQAPRAAPTLHLPLSGPGAATWALFLSLERQGAARARAAPPARGRPPPRGAGRPRGGAVRRARRRAARPRGAQGRGL